MRVFIRCGDQEFPLGGLPLLPAIDDRVTVYHERDSKQQALLLSVEQRTFEARPTQTGWQPNEKGQAVPTLSAEWVCVLDGREVA